MWETIYSKTNLVSSTNFNKQIVMREREEERKRQRQKETET